MENSITTPNLRSILLDLIQESWEQFEHRSLFTIDIGGHGVVKVAYLEDGVIHFQSVNYNRNFTLGGDGVLVENIPPPTPSPEPPPSIGSLEEEILRSMVAKEQIPYDDDETMVIKWGSEPYTCILTRTKKGVVADFVEQDTCLFYQFGSRRVKSYPRSLTSSARREAQAQRERERVAPKPVCMVEQLDYHRNVEWVDSTIYKNRLECKCGNVRWIKDSDKFQCHTCKPCVQKSRNRVKVERKKRKRKGLQ